MRKHLTLLAIFLSYPALALERIPQSVAQRVALKAYLSSDHISAATSKSIAVVISKNGAGFGNPSAGATNASEIANGWYYVDLSTTDTGTLGPLVVRGTCATCDDVEVAYTVASANNAGFAGVPDAAAAASGGLPIIGTNASGSLTNVTVPTVTSVTNAIVLPTGTGAGQISLSSGAVTVGTNNDKTGYTASTVSDKSGYSLAANQHVIVDSGTVTTVTNQLTAAQIATGIWQDATAGDFTTASSIGKSLYTSGNAPGAASGLSLVGSNMGTVSSVTGSVGSVTGSVGGSVASVTGAVGSVAGNVGGNVTGSVASVTGSVGSVTSAVTVTSNADITAIKTATDKLGFTGAGPYYVRADMVDIAGAPVSTSTAQIGVNAVQHGGTVQTGRDIGASVLLSSGTGAGQISLSSGAVTVGTNNDKTGYTASTVTDKTGYSITGDLSATMKTSVEIAVWDATASSHNTAGTTGNKLNNAASAGDPWGTSLPGVYGSGTAGYILGNMSAAADPWGVSIPGAYGAGTAGYIVGNRLDAAISSRSTYSGADTAGTTTLLSRIVGTLASGTHNPQSGDIYALANGANGFSNIAANVWTNATRTISAFSFTPTVGGISAGVDFTAAMKSSLNAATPSVSVSDKTGFSLISAYDPAKTAAQASTALSNVTWTDARAGKLDNLDTTVGSRLATSGYTAPPSAAAIADAVLDEPGTGHAGLIPTNLDARVSQVGGGSAPTAVEVADAVWDEVLSGHAGAGSTGQALSAAGTAGDPWLTQLPGAYTGNQAGAVIGAIKAKTDSLGGAGAITWPYTVTHSVTHQPIAGVKVWITTDRAGLNVIASATTDQYGVVSFQLDPGAIFVWSSKTGYTFTNPKSFTVTQ
jgi:hypothetical protein